MFRITPGMGMKIEAREWCWGGGEKLLVKIPIPVARALEIMYRGNSIVRGGSSAGIWMMVWSVDTYLEQKS